MKSIMMIMTALIIFSTSAVHAAIYTGAMDTRSGQQFIPGLTAQSKALLAGGNPGEGMRLEWQVDTVTNPGSWTYTYRLLRGTAKNKGFAFFDIETASDFTAANILSRQVSWATNKIGSQILSGLGSVTISDPVNFNAVHDFSNAAVTERSISTVLDKFDLSHYSGDPGRVAPGVPGGDASYTPSVGPVAHPFYGIRVTFPGSFSNLAYEASEWEFRIVSDRAPMWGSCFGWGDQTVVSPYWYVNFHNDNIDNPLRLTLPPASNIYGMSPYKGWILVPGPQSTSQASLLTVDMATYSRSESGEGYINLLATAVTNATLTVTADGFFTPVVMEQDTPNPVTFGKFMARIAYTTLPASVDLSNNFDPVGTLPYTVPLVDDIVISQSEFDPATRTITIKAASRDRLAPLPTLKAVDFAEPNTFDASGTFTKTLTANPPTAITVVSTKGGTATASVSMRVPGPTPATGVTLLPDKTPPQQTGTTVTFTAAGQGGSGTYEYRFWLNSGSGYTVVQDYSISNTFAWIPGSPGAYDILVDVRNAGSTAVREAFAKVFFYKIAAAAATGVTLTPNLASPRSVGTPITFTAAGEGGSGTYEYRFWLNSGSGFTIVQNYSATNTFVWTPTAQGAYDILVDVRNAGSTAFREAFKKVLFYQIQ